MKVRPHIPFSHLHTAFSHRIILLPFLLSVFWTLPTVFSLLQWRSFRSRSAFGLPRSALFHLQSVPLHLQSVILHPLMHLPKKNCLPHHFPDLHFRKKAPQKFRSMLSGSVRLPAHNRFQVQLPPDLTVSLSPESPFLLPSVLPLFFLIHPGHIPIFSLHLQAAFRRLRSGFLHLLIVFLHHQAGSLSPLFSLQAVFFHLQVLSLPPNALSDNALLQDPPSVLPTHPVFVLCKHHILHCTKENRRQISHKLPYNNRLQILPAKDRQIRSPCRCQATYFRAQTANTEETARFR